MRSLATLCVALLVLPLGGCLDPFGRAFDDRRVARTPIDEDGWNTDGVFTVQVREATAVLVDIEGKATDGRTITASGPSAEHLPPVELVVPDGTWTLRYYLDGKRWETFQGARFDSTPPQVAGLQTLGDAKDGSYVIGQGTTVEPGVSVQVVDQDTGLTIAGRLPATITGLGDGVHAYDVILTDEAGNQVVEQVQVRSGAATLLPDGQNTFGLVARYAVAAELWDIEDLEAWITPAQARAATGDDWLGPGRGIAPDDDAVQAVVDGEVTADMTAGEAAFALFRWMADNLEYDKARLEATTLLQPHQTLLDQEDPDDRDSDEDGFVRDGEGNGVRGGVCRDLAALYVSLLRAAGIPARLVTGYLGGDVDGFHAWVEFYGGDGHGNSPWVPVDVSAITGPYKAEVALQAFGLRHTDMLPLRIVTEAQEEGPWSTAVGVRTQFPAGKSPDVELAKGLTPQFTTKGTLCVNPSTLARTIVSRESTQACTPGYTHGFPGFVRTASHVLDYGAVVASASSGTVVTLTLSYPDPAAVAPGTVDQATYCSPAENCSSFAKDPAKGVTVGTWSM